MPVGRSTRNAEWGTAAALAGLAVAGNTFSASALLELGPATLSVVMRTEVLAVGGLGWLLLGEKPGGGFWFGALLALIGLGVLNGVSAGVQAQPAVVYGLLAALCFSAMQLLARRMAAQVDLVRVNTRRLWLSAGSLVFWPGVVARLPSLPGLFWVWVSVAALCGPVTSRLLLMHSVRHVAAAQTSLVMLTAPLFALILGFAVLSDTPSTREMLGGAIMLVGIGAALLRR
jgi:drug/metabolite transporter (DMT)-like permease